MVEVEQSRSGQWWRMKYLNHWDVLDHEPTADDKAQFVASVTRERQRAAIELPPVPVERKSEADYQKA